MSWDLVEAPLMGSTPAELVYGGKSISPRKYYRLHSYAGLIHHEADYLLGVDGHMSECEREEADLVSSQLSNGHHIPLMDLDASQLAIVGSTTPGHYHGAGYWSVSWEDYRVFLQAARGVGVLQEAWVRSAKERGEALLWMPGKKEKVLALARLAR